MDSRSSTASRSSRSRPLTDRALPLSQQTLSVGQLTRYLRALVEQDDVLAALSVHGEISDLSRAASGHLYFTLKDATSQLACVLFRREALQQAEIARELRRAVSVIVHG